MPAIGAAVGVIVGAIGTAVTAIGATAVGSFFLRIGATVALSALARALAPKPRDPGIQTQSTQTGGINPQSFVLGTYATAGTLVAPPMTHGPGLAYLTYVIALGAVPGQTLGRVAVNDEWVELDIDNPNIDYGFTAEAGSKYVGKLWVKFHDGSQSAADPMLLAQYGNHPDYPWTSSMVGEGIPHAICTFVYNRTLYSGLPKVLFEQSGIPLYDLRKGDTLGGTGTHRWTDRSTWEATDNPVVMIYNILRGISVGADIWGGGVAGGDLPFDAWAAAMTQAEAAVSLANGTTEPAWRAGFEVRVDEEPLGVIDELLKACSGDLTNTGGTWTIRIGEPALPVLSISDDDIIITEDQQLNPFPGLDATFNGVTARYPEPVSLYQSREAPPRFNAGWEDDDGNRRLVADLSLPAVPYPNQVQRLMRALVEDERRFIRHTITLPPSAIQLEPLDTISWSSARNGYVAKLFEVASVTVDPMTLLHRVTMRERDASDYDWVPGYELPDNPVLPSSTLPLLLLSGFTASSSSIKDAAGTDRRPAIRITWDGDQPRASALEWELRLAGGATVVTGSESDVARGAHVITRGLLPATAYEVRARLVADISAGWTGWVAIATGDVRIGTPDIDPGAITWSALGQDVQTQIDSAGDANASAQVATDARTLAESARDAAQTARVAAELAEAQAGDHQSIADTAATNAQTARSLAESARDAAQAAGISATTQAGIAVSASDNATRVYELSGPLELTEPIGAWTNKSTDNTTDKAGLTSGIVTGDPDFGECYTFPAPGNATLGQRAGQAFDPDRIFEVTFVWKVSQDGTSGAINTKFGCSTMAAEVPAQANLQSGNHTYTVADGPQSTRVQFGRSGVVNTITQILTGADDHVTWSTASDTADRIWFHMRQNSGGSSDGLLRVDSIRGVDVTERVQSALSASAAAVSESSASASETAVGQSATAANIAKVAAQTAQANANTSATTAAISETSAAGSAASAATSASVATASANDAGDSATAAHGSASTAATHASAASASASAAQSARTAAETARAGAEIAETNVVSSQTSASGSAASAAISAAIAAQSVTDAGNSATAASGSASNASTSATDAAQSATAASGHADTAATQAGNASVSASSAATSQSNAEGSANSAASNASLAATTAGTVNNTAATLGPVVPGLPETSWTARSAAASAILLKDSIDPADIVSDVTFASAYAFPTTANLTLGQAYPFDWSATGVFSVSLDYKVVEDGTIVPDAGGTPGPQCRIGGTVQAGTTLLQSNRQETGFVARVADGVQTREVWFTRRASTDMPTLPAGVAQAVYFTSDADGGNKFYPHVRQNWSGTVTTNGRLRIGAIRVKDITAYVDALIESTAATAAASAAATSSSSAAAHETAAGQSASAADTSALDAATSAGNATSSETAAASSATHAAGSAAYAANSAGLAAQSASDASSSASNASVSAASAATSESSAAGSASSASSNASLASSSESSASGHAANASVSDNNAAISATNAGDAASGAIAARDVAARIYGGEAFSNPILAGWPGTYPDGFTNASVSEGAISKVSGKYGNALRLVNTTNPPTTNKPYIQLRNTTAEVTLPDADTCTGLAMTVELSKVSGYWANGGCVRIQWYAGTGGASASVYFFFVDFAGGRANGEVFPMEIVALRPDSYVAGTTAGEVRVFFYATSTLSGHTRQNGKFDIHRVSIRELTNAASTTLVQKAITDLKGNAAASFVLRAKAGGATGAVEIVAADDPVNGAASKVSLSADEIELAGDVLTSGNITSTNYAEDGGGNPTAGYKLGLDGTIKAREVIATDSLQNNAVTVTRYSSGLKDESITWTPAHNSEVVIMVFYDLVVAGGTNNDWAKYAILKDGVEQTYRQINGYFNGGQDRGTIVARVSATANSSITIKADWSFASGSGIPSGQFYGSCDLIVFEAKK